MFVRGFAGVSKVLLNFEKLCAEPRREMGHRFRGHMPNRHRDPKWKKYRANQTFRLKLPDYEEMRKDFSHLSPDEVSLYGEDIQFNTSESISKVTNCAYVS